MHATFTARILNARRDGAVVTANTAVANGARRGPIVYAVNGAAEQLLAACAARTTVRISGIHADGYALILTVDAV